MTIIDMSKILNGEREEIAKLLENVKEHEDIDPAVVDELIHHLDELLEREDLVELEDKGAYTPIQLTIFKPSGQFFKTVITYVPKSSTNINDVTETPEFISLKRQYDNSKWTILVAKQHVYPEPVLFRFDNQIDVTELIDLI